ncbi:MAG TPA: OB-fold domain-containing protein [Xanthobacteraceae bacterium]|nr:OB-fold domain-containing protein [Xanthobacteraceae bacterium]
MLEIDAIAVPDLADPLFAPFWQGTRHGELRIQYCAASDRLYWPPRIRCHISGSTDMSWVAVAAKGTVYSYVVVGKSMIKGFEAPYTIALVTLDGHPHIRVAGVLGDGGTAAIGAAVEGVFRPAGPAGEFVLLNWRPVAGV